MKKLTLIWTDANLQVVGSTHALEKHLTFVEKRLEPDPNRPWDRMSVKVKVPLYVVQKDNAPRVVMCHQGLWRRVMQWARENKFEAELVDARLPFPAPRFDLFHGLRGTQPMLLIQGLSVDASGLIEAPTRFGKSRLLVNTLRAYTGLPSVLVVPGRDLLRQTKEELETLLPHRKLKVVGMGSTKPSDDITLCSMDSMHKCEHGRTRLVLIDEPHMCVTDKRAVELAKFTKARKLGFTATPTGRFDNRDMLLEALVGPVLARKTYTEAVAEGAILQIIAITVPLYFSAECNGSTRDQAYRRILWRNPAAAELIAELCNAILPEDWQTIVFISNEEQAEMVNSGLEHSIIAMAKQMTDKQREAMMKDMAANRIKRCVSSNILSTGVTFPDLRAIIMAAGGGGSITAIQKPGRLAQVMPGKNFGYVLDLVPTPIVDTELQELQLGTRMTILDARAREQAYRDRGYIVEHARDAADVGRIIANYENSVPAVQPA